MIIFAVNEQITKGCRKDGDCPRRVKFGEKACMNVSRVQAFLHPQVPSFVATAVRLYVIIVSRRKDLLKTSFLYRYIAQSV